jgi:hypothetical protein
MREDARRGIVIALVFAWLLVSVTKSVAQTDGVIHHDPVVGTLDLYVYVADFTDSQVRCTFDEIDDIVARTIAFYSEASFGQLTVVPHVLRNPSSPDGHFDVPHPCSDLLTNTGRYESDFWDDIRTATGVDLFALSATKGVKIMKEYSCFRGGSAGLGSPLAQVGNCWDVGLFAHEFGHTLGMAHASSNRRPGSHVGEYADREVMGRGGLAAGVNAPHRMQMGWIPADEVRTVTGATDVVLTDLADTSIDGSRSGLTSVIRIPKSSALIDSPLFKDYYYLSLQDGRINVHGVERAPGDTQQNEIVFGNTLFMGRLGAATGTYRDRNGRFTVTSTSSRRDEAQVRIEILLN